MNATTACQCIITLSLVSLGIPTETTAITASGSDAQASQTPESRKPANRDGTMRGTAPAVKPKPSMVPSNPAQQVEERVRSGQMDQPVAQGEISERLNQLGSGSKSLFDNTASTHSGR